MLKPANLPTVSQRSPLDRGQGARSDSGRTKKTEANALPQNNDVTGRLRTSKNEPQVCWSSEFRDSIEAERAGNSRLARENISALFSVLWQFNVKYQM